MPLIRRHVLSMYAELTLLRATFFTTPPTVCFPFHFVFMEFLPALSALLGRLMRPRKRRMKISILFIRLLGQSLTNDLAIIFAVFGMLLARLHRAAVLFGQYLPP